MMKNSAWLNIVVTGMAIATKTLNQMSFTFDVKDDPKSLFYDIQFPLNLP